MLQPPDPKTYLPLIEMAYREDYQGADITSDVTIPADMTGAGAVVFRQAGILCGMPVVREVLNRYDKRLQLEEKFQDGQKIGADVTVATISGPLRSILAAERPALNFLQRLSAIATQTAKYVELVKGTAAKICDTRKTTPGFRTLEKYAVRCAGGCNHRQGLFDAVLIKDNHLAALGQANLENGLLKAMENIRQDKRKPDFVEVEVDNLEQLATALTVDGINMILLDNMNNDQLSQAVQMRDKVCGPKKILLEASGGVTIESAGAVAQTGVDRISIGALTHSVSNLDIGLDF